MPPRFSTTRRRERRALAARREVARPKVGDDEAARALGEDGRVADLERRAQLRMVRHGLAVRGDQRHALERHPGAGGDAARSGREAFAELDVEAGQLRQHLRPGQAPRGEGVDARLERVLERRLLEGEQAERLRRGAIGPLHERRVHAVGGRPRHQPDHEHAAQDTGRALTRRCVQRMIPPLRTTQHGRTT
jgi:hypothetical protein